MPCRLLVRGKQRELDAGRAGIQDQNRFAQGRASFVWRASGIAITQELSLAIVTSDRRVS
jgi:hypothetical protein